MPQRLQPCQILDPGRSLREKASYVNPIRDEEFWEKFHRKHKQVFGEVKEKIKLETWKVEEVLYIYFKYSIAEAYTFILLKVSSLN